MYYVVFALVYLISLFPLPVLYLLSDFVYFIIYYVFGYRKKVVMQNLTIAFPLKTEEEKVSIAKKFYKNFCDTFIETIKFISADKRFFRKRFVADYSMVDELFKTGKSIQLHLGHNFNWEIANLTFPFFIPYKTLIVYLPLTNKTLDRLFKYIRSRFGSQLIAATQMRNEMMPHRGTQYIIALIADQSPPAGSGAYWVNFFGKPTPFLKTPENVARRNNYPVFFSHFTKVKRGVYHGHNILCTDTPKELAAGELTKSYAQFLEKVMTEHPEMWLWSHRRWKHEWKEEYGKVM
jgi:KDO2-lipid IV(A) lauroyltransferase